MGWGRRCMARPSANRIGAPTEPDRRQVCTAAAPEPHLLKVLRRHACSR